jgi:hypothetical protein
VPAHILSPPWPPHRPPHRPSRPASVLFSRHQPGTTPKNPHVGASGRAFRGSDPKPSGQAAKDKDSSSSWQGRFAGSAGGVASLGTPLAVWLRRGRLLRRMNPVSRSRRPARPSVIASNDLAICFTSRSASHLYLHVSGSMSSQPPPNKGSSFKPIRSGTRNFEPNGRPTAKSGLGLVKSKKRKECVFCVFFWAVGSEVRRGCLQQTYCITEIPPPPPVIRRCPRSPFWFPWGSTPSLWGRVFAFRARIRALQAPHQVAAQLAPPTPTALG